MKVIRMFLVGFLLLGSQSISAEETGEAAVASVETVKDSQWQNWVFATSALITLTVGVVIVSLNPGSTAH